MGWLRAWMRNWLGLDEDVRALHARVNALQEQLTELAGRLDIEERWRRDFIASLRGRVREKTERRYTDFETSQAEMLEEFREA